MKQSPIRSLSLMLTCAVIGGPLLFALAPQKRVTDKEVVPFETRLSNAQRSWDAKHYGTGARELKDALKQVQAKHMEVIRAAMPTPGVGWEKIERKKGRQDDAAMAQMFGMGGGGGNVVEEYKHAEGGERLKITVTMDAPMVSMMAMAMNPAMMEEGSELIEYDKDKATLKNKNKRSELTLILDDKHMIQAEVRNLDDKDFLLGIFDQAAVDKIRTAIEQ